MAEPIRLVLVEDNQVFREALELLLGLQSDIEVVASVGDGSSAAEVVRTHKPDVVLMDYRLPGLDGVQATLAVREAYPDVAVVCLTASANLREVVALYKTAGLSLRDDLETLPWMRPETRRQATAKLEAFAVKIGYTDKWRDYSGLMIDRKSYADNQFRGGEFEFARRLDKIGKPVDRTEWGMTPPTVNAYNNSSMNEIVFPAGIMQPPFYDPKADDAVNYGGMGAVIGHEITHGFDDRGSQFDGQGNLSNWWSAEDRKNFDERASCVEKQFDGYEVEPGLHQNGKLVLGESIADLGGLAIAYAAYQKSLEGKPRPKEIDGFTAEQRFFLGWAQVWGANQRPEAARLQTKTNPHPLARFRGNGPLSNLAIFAQAFGCKKGDAMVREQACKIW